MDPAQTREAPTMPGPLAFLKVPLCARGGGVRAYATVDAADSELLVGPKWFLNSQGYAVRQDPLPSGKQRTTPMHRVILGLVPGDGLEADHISHDKLDNRRFNLRIVTHAQNMQNRRPQGRSRYRGVSYIRAARSKPWRACGSLRGKQMFLGYFATEEEAAEVARAFRAEHMPFARD